MKKFFTTVIALCLCLAISVLAVGCGEQNAYKKFVKKWGSHAADIKVEDGTLNNDFVMDYYSLTGNYQGYTSGSFTVMMKELTYSKGAEPGSYDDTFARIEFSIHYQQAKDELKIFVPLYTYCEGSSERNIPNMALKYEFNTGLQYGGQSAQASAEDVEEVCYIFDANKYFDDNKLTLEDASQVVDYTEEKMNGVLNTDKAAWMEKHATWKEDMIADILDAINKTLGEVDKIIEAKMGA